MHPTFGHQVVFLATDWGGLTPWLCVQRVQQCRPCVRGATFGARTSPSQFEDHGESENNNRIGIEKRPSILRYATSELLEPGRLMRTDSQIFSPIDSDCRSRFNFMMKVRNER